MPWFLRVSSHQIPDHPGKSRIPVRSSNPSCHTIYAEEVGHVAHGAKWFRHLCAERGLAPAETFHALVRHYFQGTLKPPFNAEKRDAAGLPPDFYQPLAESLADSD